MSAEVPETEATRAEEQCFVVPDKNNYGPVPPAKDVDPEPVKADDDETIVKPTNNYGP